MEDDQDSAEARIEAALIAATETQKSPAMTLYRVMAALGFNFGDPDEIEHTLMQHYADPERNPFVQAQIEAKILFDVGDVERMHTLCKKTACKGTMGSGAMAAAIRFADAVEAMHQTGIADFNDALSDLVEYRESL